VFLIVTEKEKRKKDFTIAICDNGKELVYRKDSLPVSGYEIDFLILGPQWKLNLSSIRKLPEEKRKKLLKLLSRSGLFVKTTTHYYQIAVYLEKKLNQRKSKTEKVTT